MYIIVEGNAWRSTQNSCYNALLWLVQGIMTHTHCISVSIRCHPTCLIAVSWCVSRLKKVSLCVASQHTEDVAYALVVCIQRLQKLRDPTCNMLHIVYSIHTTLRMYSHDCIIFIYFFIILHCFISRYFPIYYLIWNLYNYTITFYWPIIQSLHRFPMKTLQI